MVHAIDHVIEALILQALVFQALHKAEPAADALKRALSLAEPAGYIRLFVDEGAPMGDLLRLAAARGIAINYVNRLLTALQADQDHKASLLQPSALSPHPSASD
jgi:LuxR family maltose regulon positive regulatory protein